jgi:hypothetical protein
VSKPALTLVAALALAALASSALQERVKPKQPKEVPALLDAAKRAFAAEKYGACMNELQEAVGLVARLRQAQILAALPAAPAGWEVVPDEKDAQPNPFAGALASSVGNVFSREYKETGGRGRITVQMTTDSPMVQMFDMWIQNPAMLGEGAELIKYGAHHAVLRKQNGGRLQLQILLLGEHLCDVTANGLDEDGLFGMFDQAAVDKLAGVLGA